MLKRLLDWDRDLLVLLNSLGSEEFDSFWVTATEATTWIPLFVFFILLIFWHYPGKQAWFMIGNAILLLLVVLGITLATKEGIARLRPGNHPQLSLFIRILKKPAGFSFFSGHASSSFSLTTLMVLYLRNSFRWRYLFFIWPVLFALSRIYVGVHYPIDILVGALIGALTGVLFYRGYLDIILPYIQSAHRE